MKSQKTKNSAKDDLTTNMPSSVCGVQNPNPNLLYLSNHGGQKAQAQVPNEKEKGKEKASTCTSTILDAQITNNFRESNGLKELNSLSTGKDEGKKQLKEQQKHQHCSSFDYIPPSTEQDTFKSSTNNAAIGVKVNEGNTQKHSIESSLERLDQSSTEAIGNVSSFSPYAKPSKKSKPLSTDFHRSNMIRNDEIIAKKLQEEENALYMSEIKSRNRDVLLPKKDDIAWNFVETIIDRHKKIKSSPKGSVKILPISTDDMYDVAKAMFSCQEKFLDQGAPVEVTIGYHYTHESCINSISEGGLIAGTRRGYFGDGIYLSDNASAFSTRGPVGLMVAILKGKCVAGDIPNRNEHKNTFIGNKGRNSNRPNYYYNDNSPFPSYYDEIVLQTSCQCVPIIRFDTSLVDVTGNVSSIGNECIWTYHREIQRVVNMFYNSGVSLSDNMTKSDIFPDKSKKYVTLIGEMSGQNLPQHHFDEGKRYDAIACLLSNDSISTVTALKYVGFVNSEVNDPILQQNVKDMLIKLKEDALSNQHTHTQNLLNDTAYLVMTSVNTLSEAMMKKGLTLRLDTCYEILQHMALYAVAPKDTYELKIFKAAKILANDMTLPIPCILMQAGFNDWEAHDPICQRDVKRHACDLTIELGLVGKTMASSSNMQPTENKDGEASVRENPNIGLDNAAKLLAANDKCSSPCSIEAVLIRMGYTHEESNDYRRKIHVRIKANLLRRDSFIGISDTVFSIHPRPAPIGYPKASFTPTTNIDLATFVINDTVSYSAPNTMLDLVKSKIIQTSITNQEATCSICLSKMNSNEELSKINIPHCDHIFHRACIMESMKYSNPRCPICRKLISDEPQGSSPSGTMTISMSLYKFCSGFQSNSAGTIVINYLLHGGVQKEYHPNPGRNFTSISRRAFLPNNMDGRNLLLRLKYAFQRGLIFTVGVSMTTGEPDCITWSSIHHKTSMQGGVRTHGFPDNMYFTNCNQELDALGVP
jgi:deltex-like protein